MITSKTFSMCNISIIEIRTMITKYFSKIENHDNNIIILTKLKNDRDYYYNKLSEFNQELSKDIKLSNIINNNEHVQYLELNNPSRSQKILEQTKTLNYYDLVYKFELSDYNYQYELKQIKKKDFIKNEEMQEYKILYFCCFVSMFIFFTIYIMPINFSKF
jgi:hypothetical protein